MSLDLKYAFFTDRYVTSLETGSQPVTDIFHFVVYDGDNNRLDNQMCTITITSTPRQPPTVTVHSGIKVDLPYNPFYLHIKPGLGHRGQQFSCDVTTVPPTGSSGGTRLGSLTVADFMLWSETLSLRIRVMDFECECVNGFSSPLRTL